MLATASLSNVGVSLYTTDRAPSTVQNSSEEGNGSFGGNNTISTIQTTTVVSTTTPTLYPPTPEQAPIANGYDDWWLVASPQREVMVTIIPKVMCSSIRTAMNEIECHRNSTKNYNPRCAEARKSPILRKTYPSFSNFTHVVFYRDPIERALSTYYNSETNRYIFVNGCETWKDCSFDYWVQQLAPYQHVTKRRKPHKNKDWNEHFMKQTVISQCQKMHYHYRLRMTNKDHTKFFFEQLLKTKPKSVNQSSNSKSKTTTSNSTTTISAMDETKAYIAKKFEQVSKEALARLLVIYEDDFKLWKNMVASSPRGPNEYTMYDFYMEHLEEEMRPHVERVKKELGSGRE